MLMMSTHLERDLATPASQAFAVLVVELDSGPVYLAGRKDTLGDDVLHAALLSVGEVSSGGFAVEIEQQALPAYADGWWINRPALLLECTPDMGSVHDGAVRFDGIIEAEPAEQAGVLSLNVVPRRKTVKTLPGMGLITVDDWPLAADAAMGAEKPLIFGTVDACPLLPVQVQPWTTLTAAALPDTRQLEVADAAALAASGSVVVDGITYAYTHKSDNALFGMSITRSHPAGTLVAQSGSNVYLAAGHAVSSIADIRAGDVRLDTGTVNLTAATVTFAAPPAVPVSATRYTLTEHFDSVAGGNTATNAANAIRAALGSFSQGGTPSGTVTAATPGQITFSRPADGNRIISGAYSVQFSVAVGAQVGWARVRIGNDVVWSYDPGVGVIYNASQASSIFDDDVDVMPVVVEVQEGGSTNQVTVTVLSASRVVVTGNLDEANYATVAPGNVLKVTQTDTPPDRGRIAKAMLVVRWFATDAALGTTEVKFGGRSLGKLALTPNSGASINKTVGVSSVTQGSASFPTTAVSTSATKTDSAIGVPVNAIVNYTTYKIDPASTLHMLMFPVDVNIALPANVVAGTYTFTMQLQANVGAPGNFADAYFYIGDSGQYVFTGTPVPLTFSVALSEGQSSLRIRHIVSTTNPSVPLQSYYHPTIKYISGSVNCQPTKNAISVAAASQSLSSAALANSGIGVSLSNNTISLTVPAPPRVVNTVFDLAGYTDWASFAGKTAEISLSGQGASLAIVETYLAIEFDEITYAAAEDLTATVTGQSGNPASVIATLAAASGESVDLAAKLRLSDWAATNNYAFARRLGSATDALTLLTYAAQQAACDLTPSIDGLVMRRWADQHCDVTAVSDDDLLDHPAVAWADPVETAITLRYREDYASGAGMTRVLQATAGNNATCAQTEIDIRDTRAVELDGGWLRDDATAAQLLAAYVDRYARMRRTAHLALPYTFAAIEAGSLLDWRAALWRVRDVRRDGGWIGLDIEETQP